MAKQTEKPDTSLKARRQELDRAHDLMHQAREHALTAMKILSELQHAATVEEGEILEAKLAAAREAAGEA